MKNKPPFRSVGDAPPAEQTTSNVESTPSIPKAIIIAGSSVMATRSSSLHRTRDGSLIFKRRHSMPLSADSTVASTPDKLVPFSGGSSSSAHSTRSSASRKVRNRHSLAASADDSTGGHKFDRKRPAEVDSSSLGSIPKRLRTIRTTATGECVESDAFCWMCHTEGDANDCCCELCPRLYHARCLSIEPPADAWVCPECERVMKAEDKNNRSKAMSMVSVDMLCTLLKFVIQRMKYPDSEPFHRPVDCALFPRYTDYVYNPMDFVTLERNIKKKMYGSTEALTADVKWILHNCIVYNGKKHKLTSVARTVMKICRHETSEIEVCPDCYLSSCTKPSGDWFCEPCRVPHTLVWAKMKGYPFWPAKVLREENGQLDVRFFGEHDRAWVPVSQVFMISEEPPTGLKNRKGFDNATEELRKHVEKLREQFGSFTYAPHRTPYDPRNPYSKVSFSSSGVYSRAMSSASRSRSRFGAFSRRPKPTVAVVKNTATDNSSDRPPVKMILKLPSADKHASIATETARALKLKYSSIISTRRASTATSLKRVEPILAMSVTEEENVENEDGVMETSVDSSRNSDVDANAGLGEGVESCSDSFGAAAAEKSEAENENCVASGEVAVDLFDSRGNEQTNEANDKNDEKNGEIDKDTVHVADAASSLENETCEERSDSSVVVEKMDVEQTETAKDSSDGERAIRDGNGSRLAIVDSNNVDGGNSQMSRPDGAPVSAGEIDGDTSVTPSRSAVDTDGRSAVSDAVSDTASPVRLTDTSKASTLQKLSSVIADHGTTSRDDDDAMNCEEEADVDSTRKPGEDMVIGTLTSGTDVDSSCCDCPDALSEATVAAQKRTSPAGLNRLEKTSLTNEPSQPNQPSSKAASSPKLRAPESTTHDELGTSASEAIASGAPSTVGHSLSGDSADSTDRGDLTLRITSVYSVSSSDVASTLAESASGASSLTVPGSTTTASSTLRPAARPVTTSATRTLATGSKSVEMAIDKIRRLCSLKQVNASSGSPLPANSAAALTNDKQNKDKEPACGISSSSNSNAMIIVIDDDDEYPSGGSSASANDVGSVERRPAVAESIGSEMSRTSAGHSARNADEPVVATGRPLDGAEGPRSSTELLTGGSRDQSIAPITAAQASSNRESNQINAPRAIQSDDPHVAASESQTADVAEVSAPNDGQAATSSAPASAASTGPPFQFNVAGFDFSKYNDMLRQATAQMLEVFCRDVLTSDAGSAVSKHVQLEINRFKWQQAQEVSEIRNSCALMLAEQRMMFEEEKEAALNELREQLRLEKDQEVTETKKKQWCAQCGKEAIFYCCWNTSYCDYPCQQAHWPKHMHTCTQTQQDSSDRPQQIVSQPLNVDLPPGSQQSWRTGHGHTSKYPTQTNAQQQRMAQMIYNPSSTSLPSAVQLPYGVSQSRPWPFTSVQMQSGGIMQPGPQSVLPAQYGQFQPVSGQQQQPSAAVARSMRGSTARFASHHNMMSTASGGSAGGSMMVFRPGGSSANFASNQQQSMSQFMLRPR